MLFLYVFVKRSGRAGKRVLWCLCVLCGSMTIQAKTIPQLQQEYMDLEYGMFIHFNMSTFARQPNVGVTQEWETGFEIPALFDPGQTLDCGQWARTADSAQMKYMVLTAKHHGGFCLWDSDFTTHDVGSSPWRNGKGDVLREFVDSARAYGLKVGFYYSIRDWHNGESVEFIKNQLHELLTQYGPLTVLWFDAWGNRVSYDAVPYLEIRRYVNELQPNCLVLSNNHEENLAHTDIVGYESHDIADELTGDNTMPAEGYRSIRADWCWFYHPWGNCELISAEAILQDLAHCNEANANFLFNVTPNDSGLIPQCQVNRLYEAGVYLLPEPPVITRGPSDITVDEGATVRCSVEVIRGESYAWRINGETVDTAAVLTYEMRYRHDGATLQCIVSNAYGADTSRSVPVSVLPDTIAPAVLGVQGIEPNRIVVVFSERVTTRSTENLANYTLGSNSLTIRRARLLGDSLSALLFTSPMHEDSLYTLDIAGITDISHAANSLGASSGHHFHMTRRGSVVREYWTGIYGNEVSRLYAHPSFPDRPDTFEVLPRFNSPENWGDRYGSRIRTLFTVPEPAEYTFYISANERGELWFGRGATRAGAKKIAYVERATAYHQWGLSPLQESQPMFLDTGQVYYLEAVHKEHEGWDNCAVACKYNDIWLEAIPGSLCVPYHLPSTPVIRTITDRRKTAVPGAKPVISISGHHGSAPVIEVHSSHAHTLLVCASNGTVRAQRRGQGSVRYRVSELLSFPAAPRGVYVLVCRSAYGTTRKKIIVP